MGEFIVLLVDDEKDIRETLAKRLAKRNIEAHGVESGEAALAYLAENEVDVVLLDVRMPGMDGIATLEAIKKARPFVEVVMLTGHASVEAALQGLELGAFDYLMKPADIDELLYKLQDAYKRKALRERRLRPK